MFSKLVGRPVSASINCFVWNEPKRYHTLDTGGNAHPTWFSAANRLTGANNFIVSVFWVTIGTDNDPIAVQFSEGSVD